MENSKITIKNYESALPNPYYLVEAIEGSPLFDSIETEGRNINIAVNDISMSLGNGYGTWRVLAKITIMGRRMIYELIHRNEDWYAARRVVYDDFANPADREAASYLFQKAFEAIIDQYADDILSVCSDFFQQQ